MHLEGFGERNCFFSFRSNQLWGRRARLLEGVGQGRLQLDGTVMQRGSGRESGGQDSPTRLQCWQLTPDTDSLNPSRTRHVPSAVRAETTGANAYLSNQRSGYSFTYSVDMKDSQQRLAGLSTSSVSFFPSTHPHLQYQLSLRPNSIPAWKALASIDELGYNWATASNLTRFDFFSWEGGPAACWKISLIHLTVFCSSDKSERGAASELASWSLQQHWDKVQAKKLHKNRRKFDSPKVSTLFFVPRSSSFSTSSFLAHSLFRSFSISRIAQSPR